MTASGTALAQTACPPTTVAADQGLHGAYPYQFDRAEYETAGNYTLSFSQNPLLKDVMGRAGKVSRLQQG